MLRFARYLPFAVTIDVFFTIYDHDSITYFRPISLTLNLIQNMQKLK